MKMETDARPLDTSPGMTSLIQLAPLSLAALLALVPACSAEASAPPAPAPGESAPPAETSAPPSSTPPPASTGPVVVGALRNCEPLSVRLPPAGSSLAFAVDTRGHARAHLAASARTAVDGATSPVSLALREASAKVTDGWETCVGQSSPRCFAHLEMDPGIGQRTFDLEVVPKAGAAIDATVSVCVLDPLE